MSEDQEFWRLLGVNENHYRFIRNTGLPRSSFRRGFFITPTQFLWGALATIAVALVATILIII